MKVKIAEIRKSKDFSLRMLSYKTGLNYNTIWRLERDETTIDLIKLEKIAKALNCKITDLFDSEYK